MIIATMIARLVAHFGRRHALCYKKPIYLVVVCRILAEEVEVGQEIQLGHAESYLSSIHAGWCLSHNHVTDDAMLKNRSELLLLVLEINCDYTANGWTPLQYFLHAS